jgi:hypothetical protein
VSLEHVPFGLVQGEDGKKFKTRSGETVKLVDLLTEALSRAKADVVARLAAEGREEPETFVEEVSKAVGIGAVKYADLAMNRQSSYRFRWGGVAAVRARKGEGVAHTSPARYKPDLGKNKTRFPRSTGVRGSRARCSLIEKSDGIPVFFCRLERAYTPQRPALLRPCQPPPARTPTRSYDQMLFLLITAVEPGAPHHPNFSLTPPPHPPAPATKCRL